MCPREFHLAQLCLLAAPTLCCFQCGLQRQWLLGTLSLPLQSARFYPEGHPRPSAAAAYEEESHNVMNVFFLSV